MTKEQVIGQNREERSAESGTEATGFCRRAARAAKWAAILGGTIVLYRAAAGWALMERGYRAAGGETLLLLIPLLYYIVGRIARDFAADIRRMWIEEEEDE